VESESKSVDNAGETTTTDKNEVNGPEQSGASGVGENSDAIALSPEEIELIQERKKQATSIAGKPESIAGTEGGTTVQQHHYRMLDSVLDQAGPVRHFKQPMLFDIVLALGLLVAVAGFTTGLMRIYITHMAKQSINQHNYKAAITILKRNPVPEFFSGFGSDPNELLNQALYLDAMTKLEANSEDQAALSQLSKITAGSRFFHLAQEILTEKTKPSEMQLKSGATHVASPDEMKETVDTKAPLFQEAEEK